MKILSCKGSASVELVWLAPVFLLFMIVVASFFEGFNAKEKEVMRNRVEKLREQMQQEVAL